MMASPERQPTSAQKAGKWKGESSLVGSSTLSVARFFSVRLCSEKTIQNAMLTVAKQHNFSGNKLAVP